MKYVFKTKVQENKMIEPFQVNEIFSKLIY